MPMTDGKTEYLMVRCGVGVGPSASEVLNTNLITDEVQY